LKGWYLLNSEGMPNFRFVVNPGLLQSVGFDCRRSVGAIKCNLRLAGCL
jgi:hypothetical protein